MAPLGILSEALSSVTAEKLDEISKQQTRFEESKAEILRQTDSEPNLRNKVNILFDGLVKFVQSGEMKSPTEFSLQHATDLLKQAEYDPSLSSKQLEDWQARISKELDIHTLKFEYASLYGRLVAESLSAAPYPSQRAPKSDFGFEILAETPMLTERMKWESLVFSPHDTDVVAIQEYLARLFHSSPTISDAHTKLRANTVAFEKKMTGERHFDKTSLNWVINGLLRSDLLTDVKRKELKEIQSEKGLLEEVADVLNKRFRSLETWKWNTEGVPVEQRRLLHGRSRFFHDDRIFDAIFLRYIGMKWSVYLKAALAQFQSSPGVWKSSSTPVSALDKERRQYFLGNFNDLPLPALNAESVREKHFREEIFLQQLADTVDEQRGSYDDDRQGCGDTRKSSLQITQTLLHTLATEITIKKGLCQDITILRTDFASFGPSLSHLTIVTVLKHLGVSDRWLNFFRRTLEAPVKFLEDVPQPTVQVRKRGTAPSSPLSDFMAESVLFCLDFSVNQGAPGARMYRLHDDIWLWGPEKSSTKAWEVMKKYADLTGLEFNMQKTGCVKIARPDEVPIPQARSDLPDGDITWGFLKLDSDSGRFVVNQGLLNEHVKGLREQLAACKSVIDYVQTWNIYGVRFFTNNMGKPANCFGLAHVHMMRETFRKLQLQVFDSDEHLGTGTENKSGKDITSVVQQMIFDRFGTKVSEGYLYFPTFLGGLDMKNPFMNLAMIQDTIIANPAARMMYMFKEEKEEYERARKHFEVVVIPARALKPKKELVKDRFANEPFMTFVEFIRYREHTSRPLYRVYKDLMSEPTERRSARPPNTDREFGNQEFWDTLSNYERRVVSMYAYEVRSHVGGLRFVDQGWLPKGMVAMFRESRFQCKD